MISKALDRVPRVRRALWRFTEWHRRQHFGRFGGRLIHLLWCYTAPLGNCDVCRAPTWNPVTFKVQHNVGRSGHYYCERCGPPSLEAALAIGELVTD